MFILMIMTAFLASNALAVAPADVTNPSFEDATGGVCDFWTLWDGGGATLSVYHEGDGANANTGDDYFEVGNGGAGWSGIHTASGQEVAVVPGEDYEMVFYAKTADGSSVAGSVLMKFEFYATQGEGWVEGGTPFSELSCDTTGSYQQYLLVTEVPAGMNYARATVVSTGTAVHVDDVCVGTVGTCGTVTGPISPNPGNGSIQSVTNAPSYGYTPVAGLSWTNPDLADDSVLFFPANLGVEVKFGIGATDPNFPVGTYSYSVAKATMSAFDTVALDTDLGVTLPLADATNYYWQVIVTDANSAGDVVIPGSVWSFETGDALPIIQAPADQYMWLAQDDGDGDSTIRTFTVTTTYTDDGKSPIVDANHTTGNWLWVNGDAGVIEVSDIHTADTPDSSGAQSGTVVATYRTVALGDVGAGRPLEETQLPGFWDIALEVTDSGSRTTAGDTGHNFVGNTCAEAAADGGDEAFEELVGAYDVNDDCINNLVDFAELAAVWLDASPKKE